MVAVIIISLFILAGLVVFTLCKMGTLESRIDDIYNKSFTMQGEIEANTARSKDNYNLIARVNTELETCKMSIDLLTKIHESEVLEVIDAELESLVIEPAEESEHPLAAYELSVRRENFAHLRSMGKSIKDAGYAVGVSYSTAKRYERWRKDNKK